MPGLLDNQSAKPTNLEDVHLHSNDKAINMNHVRFMKKWPRDTPVETLRDVLAKNGYLYVQSVIPRDVVLDCRKKYFQFINDALKRQSGQLTKPGTDEVEGVFIGEDLSKFPHESVQHDISPEAVAYRQATTDAHRAPFYLNFSQDQDLRRLVNELMNIPESLLLKRQLLRCNVPGGEASAVHYDQLFLRAGKARATLTAWVPIGDVPVQRGGLMYLEDSVKIGEAKEREFEEHNLATLGYEGHINCFNSNMKPTGMLDTDLDGFRERHCGPGEGTWLVADYEAGDVVFHDVFQVHAAATNQDPEGKIRLSTDLRFVDPKDEYDKRWNQNFWYNRDGL